MRLGPGFWLVAGLAACGGRDGPPAQRVDSAPAAVTVADTMVLRTPDGTEVWLAEGREGRDSTGGTCFERSVELRTDSLTRKVPLLFVTGAPVLLGRDAIRAELSLHCRTMAVYRVDLATARPTRLEER